MASLFSVHIIGLFAKNFVFHMISADGVKEEEAEARHIDFFLHRVALVVQKRGVEMTRRIPRLKTNYPCCWSLFVLHNTQLIFRSCKA